MYSVISLYVCTGRQTDRDTEREREREREKELKKPHCILPPFKVFYFKKIKRTILALLQ